jgi:hypothetical protein
MVRLCFISKYREGVELMRDKIFPFGPNLYKMKWVFKHTNVVIAHSEYFIQASFLFLTFC